VQHPAGPEPVSRRLVVHDLDHRLGPLPPAGQCGRRQVGPPGGDRLAGVAGGAEQHDEAVGVRGDQVRRHHRGSPLAGLVGGGDQAAQRRPAPAAGGEHGHPAVAASGAPPAAPGRLPRRRPCDGFSFIA
jgi:hypothetical protein